MGANRESKKVSTAKEKGSVCVACEGRGYKELKGAGRVPCACVPMSQRRISHDVREPAEKRLAIDRHRNQPGGGLTFDRLVRAKRIG